MSMISEQIEELRLMAEMFVNGEPYGNLLRRAANTIEMLSEKAREPKRGEWVKRTHNTLIAQVNFAYCSECGQPIMHEHTRSLWSFCPNCGADMRAEQTEPSTDCPWK